MPSDLQISFDKFLKSIKEAEHAFGEFSQAFANAKESFWQAYLNIGASYGETDEGFMQWLEELNEAIPDYTKGSK